MVRGEAHTLRAHSSDSACALSGGGATAGTATLFVGLGGSGRWLREGCSLEKLWSLILGDEDSFAWGEGVSDRLNAGL